MILNFKDLKKSINLKIKKDSKNDYVKNVDDKEMNYKENKKTENLESINKKKN